WPVAVHYFILHRSSTSSGNTRGEVGRRGSSSSTFLRLFSSSLSSSFCPLLGCFHLQHKQRKQKAEVEVRSRSPPSRKEGTNFPRLPY
ncbi:hypothetical protein HN51_046805, partial [Arachis hypogaea]